MKRYGFKYKKLAPTKQKIDLSVGSWIGLVGTFLFIAIAAEAGGFKGRVSGIVLFTILFIALVWFFNFLAVEHRWAKTALIIVSGIGTLIALCVNVLLLVKFQYVLVSTVLFLALNVGISVFARK